jgi:hypothetical protein
MIRHTAYALLVMLAILSSMAILQELDDRSEVAYWSPR